MKFKINIKNCYGIKTLNHEFDFSNKPIIIHAPNGTFKTSFCKTINDYNNGVDSSDLVTCVKGSRSFQIDGRNPDHEEMVVFHAKEQDYQNLTEKSKDLLVNKDLRNQLELVRKPYLESVAEAIEAVRREGGFKNFDDFLKILYEKYGFETLEEIIEYYHKKNKKPSYLPFEIKKYNQYFTADIDKILSNESLEKIIRRFEKIRTKVCKQLHFLDENVFDITDFLSLAREIIDKNFFLPGNGLKLKGKKIINSKEQLEDVVAEINRKISNDEGISNAFKELESTLKGKRGGSKLLENLRNNPMCSKYYSNYASFEELFFNSIFNKHSVLVDNAYQNKKAYEKLENKIKKQAEKEITVWQKTIDTFNNRFSNKYRIDIKNKQDVSLGLDQAWLVFEYETPSGGNSVRFDILYNDILSEGEKRAFLLLDILFDIEKFKLEKKHKILIFDDIADSLDYTNKHLIIEYLKEISENSLFDVLILTHNFDFYRHFGHKVAYSKNAFFGFSDGLGNISIEDGQYLNNLFMSLKKSASKKNNLKACISLIPFARANIENNYLDSKGYMSDESWKSLTNILHYRPKGGSNYSGNTLNSIFKKELKFESPDLKHNRNKIYRIIFEEAKKIASARGINQNISEKIVLSIALRIASERYIYAILKKQNLIDPNKYEKKTFGKLLQLFKDNFSNKEKLIKLFDIISILTPVDIHVNGFAYEPLIDYSSIRLKSLFNSLYSSLPRKTFFYI